MDLARRRPDLRVAIGEGADGSSTRSAPPPRALANLEVLGFVEDVDAVLASAGVIVYGEDPRSPYSRIACPNTLYQAVRLGRPVVFYCGGELEETARAVPGWDPLRARTSRRCRPRSTTALARDDWEFDAAWRWLRDGAEDALHARLRALVPELS